VPTAFYTPCTGKTTNCSVLQLSRFRHRGDDPILTLSEHLLHTAFCLLHVSLLAQGNGKNLRCVLQMSELQYRLGWFTVHWFHLPRDWLLWNFIFSVWLWSIKKTDTDLSDFQAFTSFTKSTNPQIHKFANPTWVCLPLHTVCCRPHFAHCTIKGIKNWHCALLCQC
jgi:hypothetical protein